MPAKKSAPTKSETAAKKPASKADAKATAAKGEAKATKPAARASSRDEKKAAPARRAVARPVTRVVAPKAERAARPAAPVEKPKREKQPGKPLPTAPEGHAPLISADGSSSGSIALPDVLAKPGKRLATLFQALIAARANARQSTVATKNRSRVAGGGAKPWRQKGTGRARQGTIRAPHWRHGGVVFGPNGRRYDQRMPEKMRKAAFASAVSARAAAGRFLVVDDMKLDGDTPRTRDVVTWLGNVGDTGRAVFVWNEIDDRKARAFANLREIEIRTPGSLRLSDVLDADTVLVMRPALDAIVARATRPAGKHDAEVSA
jgi:large subunit ribosomal protein L4